MQTGGREVKTPISTLDLMRHGELYATTRTSPKTMRKSATRNRQPGG